MSVDAINSEGKNVTARVDSSTARKLRARSAIGCFSRSFPLSRAGCCPAAAPVRTILQRTTGEREGV